MQAVRDHAKISRPNVSLICLPVVHVRFPLQSWWATNLQLLSFDLILHGGGIDYGRFWVLFSSLTACKLYRGTLAWSSKYHIDSLILEVSYDRK